jgi:hypothetical protein
MTKILILSYYYPPSNFVGAARVFSFAKQLPKLGYYPIIVTRNWNTNQTNTYDKVHDNSYKHKVHENYEEHFMPYHRSYRDRLFESSSVFSLWLRRLLTFFELVLSSFILRILPYANLYTQARKLLSEQKDIEVLIISGSPFESFHFGHLLKKEFPLLHWIPDYRDEWTAFRRYPSKGIFDQLIFSFNTYLERKYTSNSSLFISVSNHWVDRIASHIQKPGLTVMNGIEAKEEIELDHIVRDPNVLRIAYSGSIYQNQNFEPLAALLAKLNAEYKNKLVVKMDFYGVSLDAPFIQDVKTLFLRERIDVELHQRIPQEELNKLLLQCDLLYVSKYGVFNSLMPVKIFDYYNLGIPVLHYPSDNGDIEKFILTTNIGIRGSDEQEVYASLVEIIENKLSDRDIRNKDRYKKLKDPFYTREHQVSVLVNELNQITKTFAVDTHIQKNDDLRKVLILAYDFPPFVSVGGLRPFNWYKHFKEFGIYPIVITRQWDNKYGNSLDYISKSRYEFTICEISDQGVIYRTSYEPNLANKMAQVFGEFKYVFLRRFITLLFEILQFVLPVGSKLNLYREANHFLKNNKVDLILATGEPFVMFHYANKLSEEFNIPWAADYRDPWAIGTINHIPFFLNFWYKFHENRLIKKMKMAITVSEFMKKKIQDFSSNALPVHVVSNGFDGDLIDSIDFTSQKNDCLVFSYAGWIYSYHPYSILFGVLAEFKQEFPNYKFRFNFYGINLQEEIEALLAQKFPSLLDSFHFSPKLPNANLLTKLSKSDVLVLFNEYAFMGTKIYDYMGVNRFILHLFSDDKDAMDLKKKFFPMDDEGLFSNKLQEEVILYTKTGKSIKDQIELKKELKVLFEKFNNEGNISLNSEHRELYSRRSQTKKLAEIVINSDIL